ncbi:transcription-repair coupling factor, partial [bacterium]
VGRSSHRAYAYFICPEPSELTPDARKRIEVIQELCDPGSGFKIATYDLEIRGAGEFLGTTQSGHIVEVGFEMYTELLEEAVMELKGEVRENEVNPEINMKVSQFIPDDYMPDARQRLGFYKRLASVSSEDELNTLNDELSDRYGGIPPTVVNLIDVAGLKLLLKKLKAKELAQKGARLYLTLGEYTGKDAEMGKRLAEKALKLVKKEPNKYRLMPDSRFSVRLPETLAHGEAVGLARMTLKELVTACGTVI